MDATCTVCDGSFEAKTRRAKYCSGACKKRGADLRLRTGQVVTLRSVAHSDPDVSTADDGPLVASLRSAFKDDDLQSPAGQVALRLSSDLDQLVPGIPGYAAIVGQMRAAIDDLRSQATPKSVTPLTLLRERRAADRSASAS